MNSRKGLSSHTERVVTGAIWFGMAKGANILVSVGTMAVLSRLIPPHDFGIIAVATIFAGLSEAMSRGAFAAALVQRSAIAEVHEQTAFWMSLIVSGLLTLIVWAAAPYLVSYFRLHSPASSVILLIACAVPLRAVGTVAEGILQRNHRFAAITIASIASHTFAYGLVVLVLAIMGWGIWSVAWGYVIAAAIEATTLTLQARLSMKPRVNLSALRDILSFGGFFLLATLFNWGARQVDQVLVGRMFGVETLGYYSRAVNILSLATTLGSDAVSRALFPTFSRIQDDSIRVKRAFERVLTFVMPLYFCVSAFIIVHGEAIIRVLLGERWHGAVAPLTLLFLAFPARAGYKYSENLLFGLGKSGQAAARQLAFMAAVSFGAWAGSSFNVTGVALGVSSSIWGFYFLSVTAVCNRVGVAGVWVLVLHLRCLMLAAIIGTIDVVAQCVVDLGWWEEQALGTVVFGILFICAMAIAPQMLVGREFKTTRNESIKVLNRLLKPRRNV